MIKLTAAQANSVHWPSVRPGSTILIQPEDIITVEEIAIHNADGSYDGKRKGSAVRLTQRVGITAHYVEETPDEIAAKLDAEPAPPEMRRIFRSLIARDRARN